MEDHMISVQSKAREPQARKSGFVGNSLRLGLGICLGLFLSSSAFAQYPSGGGMGGGGTPGTPGYVPPKGGYGSGRAVGIGVGAAAAGAGVLYLALHHRGSVNGCVKAINDRLSLFDEKTGQTYSLLPGSTDVKSGERVELSGRRSKDAEGTQT